MVRRKTLVTYLIAYFFTIGTAFRYLSLARSGLVQWTVFIQRSIVGLFVVFFLLLANERRPFLTWAALRCYFISAVLPFVVLATCPVHVRKLDISGHSHRMGGGHSCSGSSEPHIVRLAETPDLTL